MAYLVTSDLHFNDKAMDGYRFGIFKWLANEQRKHKTEAVFILGDLTENKDRHSSALVNRVVEGLQLLKPPIYILRGNHDGIDPNRPYFKFLNAIEGVRFVISPEVVHEGIFGMIPHCESQEALVKSCTQIPPGLEAIFVHNTFEGAVAETGARLSGLSLSAVENRRPEAIWAGDIHRPQRLGRLLAYVGSPYHVRFGDDFNPRVLFVDGARTTNLHFEAPRKWSLVIRGAKDLHGDLGLHPGDQVKIEIQLPAEGAVDAAKIKREVLAECKLAKLEVFGCALKLPPRKAITRQAVKTSTHVDVLKEFIRNEGVPANYADVGYALIE